MHGHLQIIYPPIWLLAFIPQSETNVDIWTPHYGASDNISPYSHLLLNWTGLDRKVQYGYIIPQMDMAVSMVMALIANHMHLTLSAG